MSPEQQSTKYWELCVISACGILTCCLFTIFTRWLYFKGKLNQVEWDMATITAADYTVEMKVKGKAFRAWYENEYLKPGGDHEQEIPPMMSIK